MTARIFIPLALLLSGCDAAVALGNADQEFTKREAEGAPDAELCKLAKKGLELSMPKSEKAANDPTVSNGLSFWYMRVSEHCPASPPADPV